MSLLNPLGLLGFLSLPAIVWLHTHLERNRRVVVSSIFLWAFLDEKFQGQKPKFIRISWLLVLDLLIAALLSIALAKPIINLPSNGGAAVQQIIMLDSSASMFATDAEPSRFSQAKDLTIGLLENARQQDQTVVVTFGGEPKLVGNTLRDGPGSVINEVGKLSPGGMGNTLREGIALALSAASLELPQKIYIITDGAYPEVDLDDSPADLQYIFVGFENANQALLSPELTLGKSPVLFFLAANYASIEASRTLEIYVDESLVSSRAVRLPPRGIVPFEIEIPADFGWIEARIVEADQFPGDNNLYLGPGIPPEVKVLIVADEPDPIDRAMAAIVGEENVEIIVPEDFSTDGGADLVIFRGFIPDEFTRTTSLFLDPHLHNYESDDVFAVENQVSLSDSQTVFNGADFLNGLDFGSVRWGYVAQLRDEMGLDVKDSDITPLLRVGGTDLLLLYEADDVESLVLTATLEDGNFTSHPLFPIFLSQIVDFARPAAPDSAYLVGDTLNLEVGADYGHYSLQLPGGEDFIPYSSGGLPLGAAGQYTLAFSEQYEAPRLFEFGVSQGDDKESDIQPRVWRQDYLQGGEAVEGVAQALDIDLSPWLLFAVVALLFMEAWRAWR